MKSTEPSAKISRTQQPGNHSNGSISRWIVAFTLLSGLFIFPGCASIMSGTTQKLKITSSPDAADVKVERLSNTNNIVQWQGKTPASVKLSRNGSYVVTVSSNGYKSEAIPVSGSRMNGWIFGNILIGGIIGIVIDSADGAAKSLEPGAIDIKLASSQAGNGEHAEVETITPAATTNSHASSPKQMGTSN